MQQQVMSGLRPNRHRAEFGHVPGESRRLGSLRLSLLNEFELSLDGIGIPLSTVSQHLLAYLALSTRGANRTHVAGTLWGDVSDQRAAGNLRSTLWRLRRLDLDLVDSGGDHLSLSPGVVVDIHEANRIARLVLDPAADIASLSLEELPVTGELLPGWDDQGWVLIERERLRQIALHVMDALCERWTQIGQYEKAIRAGLAAVASEPLRESSHRALIAAFLAEGNPAEAIRRYRHFSQMLRSELQIEPSARITEMVAWLSSS